MPVLQPGCLPERSGLFPSQPQTSSAVLGQHLGFQALSTISSVISLYLKQGKYYFYY